MNKRTRLYESWLRRIDEAHKRHQTVWRETKTAKLAEWKLGLETMPSEKHWEANGFAYEAARPHAQTRDALTAQLFEALPFQEMAKGNSEAIDHILDFVEADIPAFRCGYAKEWCYRRLKRVFLTETQQQRLLLLTLRLCQSSGYRREIRDLTTLVTSFAHADFMRQLLELLHAENQHVRSTAYRVVSSVLLQRHDLK